MDIKEMCSDIVDWSELAQYLDSAADFCVEPLGNH
jgi:hypothetical protein